MITQLQVYSSILCYAMVLNQELLQCFQPFSVLTTGGRVGNTGINSAEARDVTEHPTKHTRAPWPNMSMMPTLRNYSPSYADLIRFPWQLASGLRSAKDEKRSASLKQHSGPSTSLGRNFSSPGSCIQPIRPSASCVQMGGGL